MEVLPNSLLKGRGSSTATWGGGTLGRVGGRRRKRGAAAGRPSSSTASCTGWKHHQAVQPSGRPSSSTASHTEEEVSSIQATTTTTGCKAMEEFWTRHGGARGRWRRGKPWESGEEHQKGGVQSCSPSIWWTSTRESESVKERVNGLLFRFSGRS